MALSDHQIKNLGFIIHFYDFRPNPQQPFHPSTYSEILPQILNINEELEEHQMKNLIAIFRAIGSGIYKKIFLQILNINEELSAQNIETIKTVINACPNICPDMFSITEIMGLTSVQCHNLLQSLVVQILITDINSEKFCA